MDKLNPANEPVGISTIVTILSWLAARFAFDLDAATATAIATVILLVGQWVARRLSVPVKKAQNAVDVAAAASPGAPVPKL
jgi:hypothetical protein